VGVGSLVLLQAGESLHSMGKINLFYGSLNRVLLVGAFNELDGKHCQVQEQVSQRKQLNWDSNV